MNKDTTPKADADLNKNINGTLTSNSFRTYLKLHEKKHYFNIKYFSLYLVVIILLLVSVLIFASTIKKAYFNSASETKDTFDNINTIKTNYQNNDAIKLEPVSQELSGLFEIPVGMKIVELNSNNPITNGLKVNDIIVSVSGKTIKNFSDFEEAIESLEEENFLIYTIYRNGVYQTIPTLGE
ncbi:MAG: PDZ domain-containing protein [Clostridia bacterium]|nr:PDZ domain-containing protein [Clostridia bacterium]